MTTKELQRQIMGELVEAEQLKKYFSRVPCPVIGYGCRIWVYVNTCNNVFNDFIREFISKHGGTVSGGYFREEKKGGASIEFYIADLDEQERRLKLAEQTVKKFFDSSAHNKIKVLSVGTWDGRHEVITIDFDGSTYFIKHWGAYCYTGNAPKNYISDIEVFTKENDATVYKYRKTIFADNLLKSL